jgi:hypothetical protein
MRSNHPLNHAAYIQGFQAGSLATQAKYRAKMQALPQPVSPAALDFDDLNMSGSPVLGAMEEASASRSSGQQPMAFGQHPRYDQAYLSGDHGVSLRSSPNVPPLQTSWSESSTSTSEPRGSYGWPVPGDHWGDTISSSSQGGNLGQHQRDSSKFPFVCK